MDSITTSHYASAAPRVPILPAAQTYYATSPKSSLSFALGATSVGDPPGRRSQASKRVPGQPVFCARLPRFNNELVQPLGLVSHVLTAPTAVNRQPDGFIERPGFQFDSVLDTLRVFERHPALLHANRLS